MSDSVTGPTAALFIGGRSGVGKSTVALEVHAQLSASEVRHCVIDGDALDMAYPPPWEHGLAEQNLAAMWSNYTALGYTRMIYTNTVSVLDRIIPTLTDAMGTAPDLTAILLCCTDETAAARLSRREIGTELQIHLDRSRTMARVLADYAPARVHRIWTDNRRIPDIAAEIIDLTGWQHQP
ncbi:adenylyl-sulfate kinase [Nocardia sp. NPDC058058]|uniref:adenylyl-sulfate kinase n=1 Tax=Nocardia sp. NPDC058058 TaxID=3346317 RepID=UPI0036D8758F